MPYLIPIPSMMYCTQYTSHFTPCITGSVQWLPFPWPCSQWVTFQDVLPLPGQPALPPHWLHSSPGRSHAPCSPGQATPKQVRRLPDLSRADLASCIALSWPLILLAGEWWVIGDRFCGGVVASRGYFKWWVICDGLLDVGTSALHAPPVMWWTFISDLFEIFGVLVSVTLPERWPWAQLKGTAAGCFSLYSG